MSRSWRKGSTRRWRKLRAKVLASNAMENKGRCTLQIPGVCTTTATCVHHTRGKAYGDDPRYLAAACEPCNLHVGDPTRHSPPPQPRSRW
ncbi:hypothetical protein Pa4123_55940 [Phytohabitans aurantiacus]|uniref:HNH domain-containing protein n=1 Tax=Phytohabitans aurantiacus TaxID=3016789 RepID=A0ABQ5R290_9ACTN|nr:hypothetical protein Pa4123_55940 [Phytohabitans aurantiacus]